MQLLLLLAFAVIAVVAVVDVVVVDVLVGTVAGAVVVGCSSSGSSSGSSSSSCCCCVVVFVDVVVVAAGRWQARSLLLQRWQTCTCRWHGAKAAAAARLLVLVRPVLITFQCYNFSVVAIFTVIYSRTVANGQLLLLKTNRN